MAARKRRSYQAVKVILGEDTWTIRFVDPTELGDNCGDTDPYSQEILIAKGLTPQAELDTILHEIEHAQCPWKNEPYVAMHATEAAKALSKLGYRR